MTDFDRCSRCGDWGFLRGRFADHCSGTISRRVLSTVKEKLAMAQHRTDHWTN